ERRVSNRRAYGRDFHVARWFSSHEASRSRNSTVVTAVVPEPRWQRTPAVASSYAARSSLGVEGTSQAVRDGATRSAAGRAGSGSSGADPSPARIRSKAIAWETVIRSLREPLSKVAATNSP